MENPWKLATIGIALTVVTAMGASLTTAYVIRNDDVPPPAVEPRVEIREVVRTVPARPRVVAAPRVVPVQAVAAPAITPAVLQTLPPPLAEAAAPYVSAAPAYTASATETECSTTGNRLWKIAKPTLAGVAVGAGVGAAGGAIADGGKGAGKGAMLGGLLGTLAGAAYGAFETNKQCGTILGG